MNSDRNRDDIISQFYEKLLQDAYYAYYEGRDGIVYRFYEAQEPAPPRGEKSAAYEEKKRERIHKKVHDFFNKAGYSYRAKTWEKKLKKERKASDEDVENDENDEEPGAVLVKAEAAIATKRDKKTGPGKVDKSLQLLQAYCESKGVSLFGIQPLPEEKQMDSLCKYLDGQAREDCELICIPLAADITGCSLQLLGNGYYDAKRNEKFSFVVFAPDFDENDARAFTQCDKEGRSREGIPDYQAAKTIYKERCEEAEYYMQYDNADLAQNQKLPDNLRKAFDYWFYPREVLLCVDDRDRERMVEDSNRPMQKKKKSEVLSHRETERKQSGNGAKAS